MRITFLIFCGFCLKFHNQTNFNRATPRLLSTSCWLLHHIDTDLQCWAKQMAKTCDLLPILLYFWDAWPQNHFNLTHHEFWSTCIKKHWSLAKKHLSTILINAILIFEVHEFYCLFCTSLYGSSSREGEWKISEKFSCSTSHPKCGQRQLGLYTEHSHLEIHAY